tara:strand:- start:1584 stop:1946 length:363 start_codon:yes stop_codon:yes gene_type:complete
MSISTHDIAVRLEILNARAQMFGNIMSQIPCQKVRYASLASGAIVAYTGMDTYFANMGANKAVHYMLAGIAPEMLERFNNNAAMAIPLDMTGFCAAAYGYAGAMALPIARDLLGRIGMRI